jgi:hypothetical protein
VACWEHRLSKYFMKPYRHKEHKWIESVNTKCPTCDGVVSICSVSHCRRHKCAKHGTFDVIQEPGESYAMIYWRWRGSYQ